MKLRALSKCAGGGDSIEIWKCNVNMVSRAISGSRIESDFDSYATEPDRSDSLGHYFAFSTQLSGPGELETDPPIQIVSAVP